MPIDTHTHTHKLNANRTRIVSMAHIRVPTYNHLFLFAIDQHYNVCRKARKEKNAYDEELCVSVM